LRTFGRVPCLCLALLSLVAAVGCGTGGSPVLNHFTGNFSDASLKGTYVYQIHAVALVNGVSIVPYRQVGVFTADGARGITGTDDSSVSSSGTAIQGSYRIFSDGTGQITFNTSSLGAIQFAVTMVSTSKVQMIENDPSLNAAGVAELQDPTAAGTTPGGKFVFRLHQEAAAQNPNSAEASQVGGFSLTSGSGSGAMDQILGTTSNAALSSPNLTVTFNAPAASGRGTATLLETTANFTTHIVYYIVNSGELALLVSDAGAIGSGSAEAQTGVVGGTGLSGSYAFGSRGDDLFLQGLATVGQFTANPGTITGVEDVMEDGRYTPNAVLASTCFAAGVAGGINGRVVATNGSGAPCSGSTTQIFWMVNPSRAFFLNDNGATFEDGTADLQTTNSFSASSLVGQYVINMDGLDRTPEQVGLSDLYLSRVGLLKFDGSSNLTLNEFANEFNGGASPGLIAGTYSVGPNSRIVANLNGNTLNLVMYAVSNSKVYSLQQDSMIITSGTLELQH
jgi:hypothetical protein